MKKKNLLNNKFLMKLRQLVRLNSDSQKLSRENSTVKNEKYAPVSLNERGCKPQDDVTKNALKEVLINSAIDASLTQNFPTVRWS